MELTPSQKETVQHQFDTLCRKVLRGKARDCIKQIARRSAREVSLSELSEEQLAKLYVLDEYPSERFHFQVREYSIPIKNELLAAALASLPAEKRSIILLYFFLGMTDQEIADCLNMVRRTVQRRRTRSLEEMKRRMGAKDDEGKQRK